MAHGISHEWPIGKPLLWIPEEAGWLHLDDIQEPRSSTLKDPPSQMHFHSYTETYINIFPVALFRIGKKKTHN